jgi:prepilin-type N-terminal cleavage/methylation domain-containing protein
MSIILRKGFTLAELLIALALLGIIASFTIPKVLESSTNAKYKAMAKEAAGMISGAYQNLKLANGLSANTTTCDLTQYMKIPAGHKLMTSPEVVACL